MGLDRGALFLALGLFAALLFITGGISVTRQWVLSIVLARWKGLCYSAYGTQVYHGQPAGSYQYILNSVEIRTDSRQNDPSPILTLCAGLTRHAYGRS